MAQRPGDGDDWKVSTVSLISFLYFANLSIFPQKHLSGPREDGSPPSSPEKDEEEKKEEEETTAAEEKKEEAGGAEVAAPTKPRRKRRRRRRVVEDDPDATRAQQVVPHHVANGRPAGESDFDSEDPDEPLHPLTCTCHDCLWWQRPPGKDDDDPEYWEQLQLEKSRL